MVCEKNGTGEGTDLGFELTVLVLPKELGRLSKMLQPFFRFLNRSERYRKRSPNQCGMLTEDEPASSISKQAFSVRLSSW